MSVAVNITLTGIPSPELGALASLLREPGSMYARIAGDAEKFVKTHGRQTSLSEHRTAERLGATPTGHLQDAYEAIESASDESAATLFIPRGSRLRAAFGDYTIRPRAGKKYLTIPANAEAYGKRAGEFDDLFFMRVGPKKSPVLARRKAGIENVLLATRPGQRRAARRFTQAEIMYFLTRESNIPADPKLIPMDELTEEARDSAEAFIDETVEAALPT
jgi:hypothetical protein